MHGHWPIIILTIQIHYGKYINRAIHWCQPFIVPFSAHALILYLIAFTYTCMVPPAYYVKFKKIEDMVWFVIIIT